MFEHGIHERNFVNAIVKSFPKHVPLKPDVISSSTLTLSLKPPAIDLAVELQSTSNVLGEV
jgi:hypothetical protein